MYARTQTFRRSSWLVDGAGTGHPTSQVTCASWVFHPPARIHVRLLGPCFKTGRLETFRQHLESAVPEGRGRSSFLSRHGGIDQVAIPAFVPPSQPMLTSTRRVQRPARDACARAHPMASKRFPLNNFKYFLTLFSKFFSSFPHGTCSLSVSRQYLALDGIYHPIWAAFPSNPTLGRRLVERQRRRRRGSHPL